MFLKGSYGLKFLQYIYYIAIYLYLINILIYFYFVIYLFSKFLLLGILHQKMAKKYFSPVNFMKNIPCLRASLNSGIYQTGTLFYHFVLFVIILWIHPQPVLGKAACLAHRGLLLTPGASCWLCFICCETSESRRSPS